MFLKRIQLSGFKSFADKITIPFDRGITGIVGPNGSGKSNVIDAVRWVMGEQSAKNLRGKVATDIIFSGSANRKPLGMAEVTLVFDNNDESVFCPPEYRHEPEISLTRRLYVDGQREYLINKKECRLKDIINFFTTTGLGGRSYSMIQQGQVDRILNAKPEDVRIILEEAAGTLIFKIRRDEAIKKLGQTRDNLARIEDILAELDRQQKTLQGQMEKAQKWREITTELKSEELSLFAHNFHFFNDQLKTFYSEISGTTEREAELLAETAQLETEQLQLQNDLDAADPGLEGLHEQVSITREQIVRAETTIQTADGRIDSAKKRLADIDKEIEADSENQQVIERQVDGSTAELSAADTLAAEIREQIINFQEEVDRVDEEAQVFSNRIEDFEVELKNIDRLLDSNTIRCEALNRERSKISHELTGQNERLTVLEKELRETKILVDQAQVQMSEQQAGLDVDLNLKSDLEQALRERQDALKQAEIKRDDVKEHYFGVRARYTSLQELEASASDVASSFAALKESHPEVEDHVLGMLTDFIAFGDDAEELSQHAKSCFEKWAERLVVESFSDLSDLVRLAHQEKLGVLPVLVGADWGDLDQGVIDTWANAVDAVPMQQYLKVSHKNAALTKLMQRLYFVPGIAMDESEIKNIPQGVIVFTSQGVRYSSWDNLTIGSSNDSKGILSRKSELEVLAEELKEAEGKLAEAQIAIDGLSLKQNEDRLALNEIEAKLRDQNKDVLEVLGNLQSVKQLYEHKQELLETGKQQHGVLKHADQNALEELSEQGQARISLGSEQERITKELNDLREHEGSIQERRDEVFRMHEGRKLELAKSEARTQALRQSFEQTKTQLERVQTVLNRRFDEKSRIEQEIDQIKNDHKSALGEIEVLLVRREALEKDLTEKREENSGILEAMREVDGKLKVRREELNNLRKFVSDKSMGMERLKVALEGVIQQSEEKYHLDIATHEFVRDEDFDSERKGRAVQKLRSKLDNIGAINMMAIEEYDTLMNRHEFISAQKSEVINSLNVLEDALEEIEETTKNKFVTTYETINAEFSNLFPVLFPGGDAHLELTSPDDPLNSGVEILARLPGKKKQRMTLLSGGEKALTAISLIFALLKTKPTPFCFLDEVDAPLDEGNVGRYNRVLETLAERFQFIIITHNRRTMEVLDTLFGVTMQEPGVSKVVGVDMNKDLPQHLQKAFKEGRPVEGASAAL